MSRDAWVPYAKYIGTGAVGGITMIVSGIWLVQLAELVGIARPISISLPITVDVGGAVATLLWIKGNSRVMPWARGVAVGSLVASVIGNTISHLIKMNVMAVTPWLIIGVGAVYPATLWLMIHLVVLSGGDHGRPKAAGRPATGTGVKRPGTSHRTGSVATGDRSRSRPGTATETTEGRPNAGDRRPAQATETTDPVATGRPSPATGPRPTTDVQRPTVATDVATGRHATGDRDDRPGRPTLRAVPTELATETTDPDISDLLPEALLIARELGRCPSRDQLLDALRSKGLSVGGRRRTAIYTALQVAWATERDVRPDDQTTGRPATGDRRPAQATETTEASSVAVADTDPVAATGTTGGDR